MHVAQFSPKSLARYAIELHRGFQEATDEARKASQAAAPAEVALYCVGDPAVAGSDVASHLQRYRTARPEGARGLVVVQWHGSVNEVPLVEEVISALRGDPGLHIAVLLHRPEEIVLRYGTDGVKRLLTEVHTAVLLGPCCVGLIRAVAPPGVAVTSIHHGFFEAGNAGGAWRYEPDTVTVVGSVTTWGELRRCEDLSALAAALQAHSGQAGAASAGQAGAASAAKRYVFLAAGSFLDQYRTAAGWLDPARHLVVPNTAVEAAYKGGAFTDERTYREWLHATAAGRVVVRGRLDPDGSIVGESFEGGHPLGWLEGSVVDFNVQMYREVLSGKRVSVRGLLEGTLPQVQSGSACPPSSEPAPKVEYSGTLHLAGGPNVLVVSDSIAMDDVATAERITVLAVPAGPRGPDFDAGAARVHAMATDGAAWRRAVEGNVREAAALDMASAARLYLALGASS